jgi:surfactin synthase thioesterase subunit
MHPGLGVTVLERSQDLGREILRVVAGKLADGVPYAIVAHSVGAWVAFEMVSAARDSGACPRQGHMHACAAAWCRIVVAAACNCCVSPRSQFNINMLYVA